MADNNIEWLEIYPMPLEQYGRRKGMMDLFVHMLLPQG
jgi:hypothetical protein